MYALKRPWGQWQNEKVKPEWEMVIRTDNERIAKAVEEVWQKNGFKTRRGE